MTNKAIRTPEQLEKLDHICERHCQALAVLDSLVRSLSGPDDFDNPQLTSIKNTIWAAQVLIEQAKVATSSL